MVTGRGLVQGRAALVVANDPSVKAGSWGARTVEKIIRMTEVALRDELPIFWFIDSAGARITDQVDLFPGRRGAGRIFRNQVALSGKVPQICCLFGPSAAGGAYIPSFCDLVIMVEANASMYLGSPRMAEMVVGEQVTLEEMGGARMHAEVSGCGDQLAADDTEAIEQAKQYFSYLPQNWRSPPPTLRPVRAGAATSPIDLVPTAGVTRLRHPYRDRRARRRGLVLRGQAAVRAGAGHRLRAAGRARSVGIVANQPAVKGGVLFVDSADKGARFIWQCDAFNVPLLYLADVPGLHDRQRGGAAGHHPARREDDHRGGRGHRADGLGDRPQGVRRRALRDGRSGLRAGRLPGAADRQDRGDGPGGGDQRGVREQDRRDRRRGRAGGVRAAGCGTEYELDIDILRLASELVIDAIVEPARPAPRADRPVRRRGDQGPALLHTAGTAYRRCRAEVCGFQCAVPERAESKGASVGNRAPRC